MKAKVTDITEKLRVKAGFLLATSSALAAIAAASIPADGYRFGPPV